MYVKTRLTSRPAVRNVAPASGASVIIFFLSTASRDTVSIVCSTGLSLRTYAERVFNILGGRRKTFFFLKVYATLLLASE
jgi:hypothetical protein